MTADLMELITAERHSLGNVLEGLSEAQWNEPSLCAGWRVREVVAHITMPFRYSTARFLGEMARSGGNFARMADRVARRDAQTSSSALLDGLRSNETFRWAPPGGGLRGALTHDVVHGLDISIPLGVPHPIDDVALLDVLDNASGPGSRKHFGVDLTGIQLQADDVAWTFGEGTPVRGQARHLLMVLCGRTLPAGLLSGPAAERIGGRTG